MKRGQLRDCFAEVGVKRLSAVDADSARSNQHEVGTTSDMRRQFLGEDHRTEFRVVYVWMGQEQDGFTAQGHATHYDARATQTHRGPEWRLYYSSNPVTEAMQEDDTPVSGVDNRPGSLLCRRAGRLDQRTGTLLAL